MDSGIGKKIAGTVMKPEQYKKLSIKEFTKAAEIYDSGHAGIYELSKAQNLPEPRIPQG